MYPRERQEHDKALGVPDAQQTGSAWGQERYQQPGAILPIHPFKFLTEINDFQCRTEV